MSALNTTTYPTHRLRPWAADLDPSAPVYSLFAEGRPLFVAARNSGETGKDPTTDAINDFHAACGHLRTHGIDVMHLLPSKERLRTMFASAPLEASRGKSGRFTNKFLAIDLLAQHGVYFLLSTGTGRKLDQDSRQPFVRRIAEVARQIRPALCWTKRVDRWSRNAWSLGEFMAVVEDQGGFIGDSRHGVRGTSGIEAVMVFFEARAGQMQADELPHQSWNGVVQKTGSEMRDGRVHFAAPYMPPPGLAHVRLRDATGKGASIIYLDTPSVTPDRDTVAYGLPSVGPGPESADQVENVRHILAHFGRRDWPVKRILKVAAERYYSTARLRSLRHDPSAFHEFKNERTYSPIRTILNNLHMYETGELVVNREGLEPIVVTNVFPLDGPWATPDDFERIRRKRAETSETQDRQVAYTFSGTSVCVNGTPARIRAKSTEPQQVYRFVIDDGAYALRDCKHVPGAVTVDRTFLGAVLADAIAAAGDRALALVPDVDCAADAELARIAIRRSEELDRRNVGSLRAEELYQQFFTATGPMQQRLQADYNAAALDVAEIDERIGELDRRAAARRTELRSDTSAARVGELLHMVASLRDPEDLTYRHHWRDALHNLELTTEDFTSPLPGRIYRLRGELRIEDDVAYALRIDTSWTTGPAARVNERAEEIVAELRRGVPFPASKTPYAPVFARAVLLRLGRLGPGRYPLMSCLDPRIVRAVLAVVHDRTTETDEHLAERLGESTAFVRRIAELYGVDGPRGAWRVSPSKVRKELYYLAAADPAGVVFDDQIVGAAASSSGVLHGGLSAPELRKLWERADGSWKLIARCDCSPDSIPMFLEPGFRDPVGPVCANCERDRAGIRWPLNDYGQWLHSGSR